MSVIGKLAVGAMAVLGAYALKSKRRAPVTTRAPASSIEQDKPTAKRAKKQMAAPEAAATASGSTARSAKRTTAHKAARRKRRDRRSNAKRPQTT